MLDEWLAQATIKTPCNLEVIIRRLDVSSSLPLMESVCKQHLHDIFRRFHTSRLAYLGCVLFFSAYRDNQSFVAETEGKDRL